jgi:hypothetical protein
LGRQGRDTIERVTGTIESGPEILTLKIVEFDHRFAILDWCGQTVLARFNMFGWILSFI